MVAPLHSNNDDDDDEDAFGSSTEKCGFVCHLITLLLAVVYTIYWCSFVVATQEEGNTIPLWMSTLPATAVCLFYAAPLLYGVLNTTLVALPTHSACWQDAHSRPAPNEQPAATDDDDDDDDNNNNGGILEIYDIDVGVVNDSVWAVMQSQHRDSD